MSKSCSITSPLCALQLFQARHALTAAGGASVSVLRFRRQTAEPQLLHLMLQLLHLRLQQIYYLHQPAKKMQNNILLMTPVRHKVLFHVFFFLFTPQSSAGLPCYPEPV